MLIGSEVAIAIATLLALKTSSFFMGDSGWEPSPPKLRKVRLSDGSMARSDLMRRKVNGRWEYRKMTEQETVQIVADLDLG